MSGWVGLESQDMSGCGDTLLGQGTCTLPGGQETRKLPICTRGRSMYSAIGGRTHTLLNLHLRKIRTEMITQRWDMKCVDLVVDLVGQITPLLQCVCVFAEKPAMSNMRLGFLFHHY